jgi:hypothetical protein
VTEHLTTAVEGLTVHREARHQHDSSCYWDVDECGWQCGTYPDPVRTTGELGRAGGQPGVR